MLGNGAVINAAASNGVPSNGAASASAADESALSTEPSRLRRRVADVTVRAVPAGRDSVANASRESLLQPSSRTSLPRAAASRSQHVDRSEEGTQMNAWRNAIKTEPAAAAAGPATMPLVKWPAVAADDGSGATLEPSVLPSAEELAVMRRLVAQLGGGQPGSQPPVSEHGTTSPQPQQQAAPAEAAADPAAALAPAAVQQPCMPVDPRPTRMYSLTRRPPGPVGHEQAARASTVRGGSAEAHVQQAPVKSATRLSPAPTAMPGAQTVAARAAFVVESRRLQRDTPEPAGHAAGAVPSVQGRGFLPHEDVGVPGLEPSPEADAPQGKSPPNTTPIWRIPTNVRLPHRGHLGWAAPRAQSQAAEAGSGGPLPPAAAVPWVPASEAGSVPGIQMAFAVGKVAGEGAAAGPAATSAAAGTPASARSPQATAETAAVAAEAWLRDLPPIVRQEVEAVRELVLPLKKLKLLADIDAHLYSFSKVRVGSSGACKRSLTLCSSSLPHQIDKIRCLHVAGNHCHDISKLYSPVQWIAAYSAAPCFVRFIWLVGL